MGCCRSRYSSKLGAAPIEARPELASVYGSGCPLERWVQGRPDNSDKWSELLLSKLRSTWTEAGAEVDVRLNDHNYKTSLGQGNTLGFVSAWLTVHEDTPADTQHGLFSEPRTSKPAIVRFSDFGADVSRNRVARMAVKVALDSAWCGEANLLFTETLDTFPLADDDALEAFVGNGTCCQKLWALLCTLRVLLLQNFRNVILGRLFRSELVAKSYYSQLPYALGEQQAMKLSLVPRPGTLPITDSSSRPRKPTAKEAPAWASQRAAALAAHLSEHGAEFDLRLQVRRIAGNECAILRRAHLRWREKPVTVATLRIPRQQCCCGATDGNGSLGSRNGAAVSTALQASIATSLGIEAHKVDKAFIFHPIMTHEANRPLGQINDFRAHHYSKHARTRRETMHRCMFKESDVSNSGEDVSADDLPAFPKMPFAVLQQDF